MASKMQYLISLPDETAEKLIELEKLWGRGRDAVVAQAIEFAYVSDSSVLQTRQELDAKKEYSNATRKLSLILEKASQSEIRTFAMNLLQQSLDEGRTIKIPSLGITIKEEDDE